MIENSDTRLRSLQYYKNIWIAVKASDKDRVPIVMCQGYQFLNTTCAFSNFYVSINKEYNLKFQMYIKIIGGIIIVNSFQRSHFPQILVNHLKLISL